MLKKIRNQENIIMMFFVVMLIVTIGYVVLDKSIIDIIYLGVLLIYFVRFLILKYRRK
ncbi:MAG: hypothetical protein IKF19_01440 [Bacilli bacterium]|nr:hypothetical protein [Bacilli bacterium]